MIDTFILEEIQACREYCGLIHRAREKAGFNSLKYPITDVKINRYFLPEFRGIIADECNIMGFGPECPPVEYETDYKEYFSGLYYKEESGSMIVWVCLCRNSDQEKLYQERLVEREVAQERKKKGLRYDS